MPKNYDLETPRFFDFVLGTDSDMLGPDGGLGALLFSKGLSETVESVRCLFLFFAFDLGVQTIPLMTTPLTISSRVTVSLSEALVSGSREEICF